MQTHFNNLFERERVKRRRGAALLLGGQSTSLVSSLDSLRLAERKHHGILHEESDLWR